MLDKRPAYNAEYRKRRQELMKCARTGQIPAGVDMNRARASWRAHDDSKPINHPNVITEQSLIGESKMNDQIPDRPATVSDLFPSDWLSPSDLDNRTFNLTIREVDFDLFPEHPNTREKVTKAIVRFTEAKKSLILNRTQANQIAAIAQSEHFGDWTGTRVTLAPGRAPNGKETIVLRAAPPPPADTRQADPPAEPAAPDRHVNALFKDAYEDGTAVAKNDMVMFNSYRRTHNETVPKDRAHLVTWFKNNTGIGNR